MPIKTLHITNAWHPTSGGVAAYYSAMLEAANTERRFLRLVAPGESTYVQEAGDYGRIYFIASPHSPFFDRRYRLLLPNAYLPPFSGALRKILEAERPELIEVCDRYSVSWLAGLLRRGWLTASAGARRPVLAAMNCDRLDDNIGAFVSRSGPARLCTRIFLGRLYIPLFDFHIANSRYTADELEQAMSPRHERQIHICPMGADIETFSSALPTESKRRELLMNFERGAQTTQKTKLLLYAGRLSPEKNLDLLIGTIEQLSGGEEEDYRLIIAGSGPMARQFEREARSRIPGRMQMLGHIRRRSDLAEVYVNCDAFIHPNPREPFGIAPLEAMAAGVPLIAPRSGGLLTYANEMNSWLANDDPRSFAGAVRSAFADSAVGKEKLAEARLTAQRHSWKESTRKLFQLYDALYESFPYSRFAR